MEKEDIISSGLLELYAAGIASEEESREVEQYVAKYPEVEAELIQIMTDMNMYVNAYALTPSDGLKDKILSRITTSENAKIIDLNQGTGAGAKVIDTNLFWKVAAAASIILLIGSVALNIITYNRYNEAGRQLAVAEQTLGSLQKENKIMEQGMDVIGSKYSVPVSLKGLEASPNANAKIFWMQNTGEVYIDPSNLPETPAGKQYQLWGIVDGKPVDGGMILTSKTGSKYRIQKMKSFGKVDAFAITLEPEKGNPTPKGPMFVMGKM